MTSRPSLGFPLRILKLLSFSIMAAPVLVLLACVAVLSDGFAEPPWWTLLAVLAAGVAAASALRLVGHSGVKAVPPGTPVDEAKRLAFAALQANIQKILWIEPVLFVATILAFIVDAGGAVVLMVGVVLTEALLGWNVWPSGRVIRSVQEALERDGGLSYMQEALETPTTATSQE